METPSSARRVTRSQAMLRKVEESETGFSKSRQRTGNQQDRLVLFDITNDSPIVGLAMGNFGTPSSTISKKKYIHCLEKQSNSPGSGEALLRDQVKNLLQKVQDEDKFTIPILPLSPVNETNNGFSSSEEQIKISLVGNKQESNSVEYRDNLITRTLFLDFSQKTEDSVSYECNSDLTYKLDSEKSTEDDDSSVWSLQVNASTTGDEYIGELCIEEDEETNNEYEQDEYDVAELCDGMKNISVNGMKFSGKHTRFVYNSDDELQGEEEEKQELIEGENEDLYSGILKLKGLPTPKGKHLRFFEEEDEVKF